MVWAGVLVTSLGAARTLTSTSARGGQVSRPAPRALVAPAQAPSIANKTLEVTLDRGAAIVHIAGKGFAPDPVLTVRDQQFIFTFAANALVGVTDASIAFDASSLPEGRYELTVGTAEESTSNAVPLIVRRR